MGTRGAARTKKRLTCTLVIDGARLSGIVLDLSASGLFVQTSANPPAGSEIGLEIDVPGQQQRLDLVVRVVRRKVVPPRLKSVVHAGLGLQIQNAPEGYFRYVAQLQPGNTPAASAKAAAPETAAALETGAPPAEAAPAAKAAAARASASRGGAPSRAPAPRQERFRVRVSQIGGSRSRSLEIKAASESEARSEAETACGEGWKILACDRVA